jgi:hypothetical protein
MAVEHPATEHRMKPAGGLSDPLQEVRRKPLGSELRDEPVVVDLALHLPWRDDEVFWQFQKEEWAPR